MNDGKDLPILCKVYFNLTELDESLLFAKQTGVSSKPTAGERMRAWLYGEDKEAIFDTIDTVKMCLKVFAPMVQTMTAKPENMKKAAQGGFINATDLADYLVKKGLPFRSAYKISGQIVAKCIADGQVLETLPLDVYQTFSPLFGEDLYQDIDLTTCVEKRVSQGGTSAASVKSQIAYVKERMA